MRGPCLGTQGEVPSREPALERDHLSHQLIAANRPHMGDKNPRGVRSEKRAEPRGTDGQKEFVIKETEEEGQKGRRQTESQLSSWLEGAGTHSRYPRGWPPKDCGRTGAS